MSKAETRQRKIIAEIESAYGGLDKVLKRFDYKTAMGFYHWKTRGIPKSLVADIHIDTGIDLKRLRKHAVAI